MADLTELLRDLERPDVESLHLLVDQLPKLWTLEERERWLAAFLVNLDIAVHQEKP